jgi:hypothetical protein
MEVALRFDRFAGGPLVARCYAGEPLTLVAPNRNERERALAGYDRAYREHLIDWRPAQPEDGQWTARRRDAGPGAVVEAVAEDALCELRAAGGAPELRLRARVTVAGPKRGARTPDARAVAPRNADVRLDDAPAPEKCHLAWSNNRDPPEAAGGSWTDTVFLERAGPTVQPIGDAIARVGLAAADAPTLEPGCTGTIAERATRLATARAGVAAAEAASDRAAREAPETSRDALRALDEARRRLSNAEAVGNEGAAAKPAYAPRLTVAQVDWTAGSGVPAGASLPAVTGHAWYAAPERRAGSIDLSDDGPRLTVTPRGADDGAAYLLEAPCVGVASCVLDVAPWRGRREGDEVWIERDAPAGALFAPFQTVDWSDAVTLVFPFGVRLVTGPATVDALGVRTPTENEYDGQTRIQLAEPDERRAGRYQGTWTATSRARGAAPSPGDQTATFAVRVVVPCARCGRDVVLDEFLSGSGCDWTPPRAPDDELSERDARGQRAAPPAQVAWTGRHDRRERQPDVVAFDSGSGDRAAFGALVAAASRPLDQEHPAAALMVALDAELRRHPDEVTERAVELAVEANAAIYEASGRPRAARRYSERDLELLRGAWTPAGASPGDAEAHRRTIDEALAKWELGAGPDAAGQPGLEALLDPRRWAFADERDASEPRARLAALHSRRRVKEAHARVRAQLFGRSPEPYLREAARPLLLYLRDLALARETAAGDLIAAARPEHAPAGAEELDAARARLIERRADEALARGDPEPAARSRRALRLAVPGRVVPSAALWALDRERLLRAAAELDDVADATAALIARSGADETEVERRAELESRAGAAKDALLRVQEAAGALDPDLERARSDETARLVLAMNVIELANEPQFRAPSGARREARRLREVAERLPPPRPALDALPMQRLRARASALADDADDKLLRLAEAAGRAASDDSSDPDVLALLELARWARRVAADPASALARPKPRVAGAVPARAPARAAPETRARPPSPEPEPGGPEPETPSPSPSPASTTSSSTSSASSSTGLVPPRTPLSGTHAWALPRTELGIGAALNALRAAVPRVVATAPAPSDELKSTMAAMLGVATAPPMSPFFDWAVGNAFSPDPRPLGITLASDVGAVAWSERYARVRAAAETALTRDPVRKLTTLDAFKLERAARQLLARGYRYHEIPRAGVGELARRAVALSAAASVGTDVGAVARAGIASAAVAALTLMLAPDKAWHLS